MPTDPGIQSSTLLEELCRVTHLCWRAKMTREGWHEGDTFDAQSLAHDALAPFEQLSRRDRQSLRVAVVAEELEQHLSELVDYERGPDRLLLIEEMTQGMRVGMAPVDEPSDEDDLLGTIVRWDVDPRAGELESIEVRWDDGKVMRYHPEARELRRLE